MNFFKSNMVWNHACIVLMYQSISLAQVLWQENTLRRIPRKGLEDGYTHQSSWQRLHTFPTILWSFVSSWILSTHWRSPGSCHAAPTTYQPYQGDRRKLREDFNPGALSIYFCITIYYIRAQLYCNDLSLGPCKVSALLANRSTTFTCADSDMSYKKQTSDRIMTTVHSSKLGHETLASNPIPNWTDMLPWAWELLAPCQELLGRQFADRVDEQHSSITVRNCVSSLTYVHIWLMSKVCRSLSVWLGHQVVLNWLVCQGNVVPIPGAKNAEQAQEFAGALGWSLTDEEVEELRSMARQVKPVIGFPVEKLWCDDRCARSVVQLLRAGMHCNAGAGSFGRRRSPENPPWQWLQASVVYRTIGRWTKHTISIARPQTMYATVCNVTGNSTTCLSIYLQSSKL